MQGLSSGVGGGVLLFVKVSQGRIVRIGGSSRIRSMLARQSKK